jgi:hypothetical protein
MVGDTGVVIESADIKFNLDGNGPRPDGTPEGWKGLLIENAVIRVPRVFSGAIKADGLGFGSGGVSGGVSATFALSYANGTFTGDLAGELFGVQGGLEEISLSFQQNIPTGGGFRGKLLLPFFGADAPVSVRVCLSSGGGVTVALASSTGLAKLTRANILEIELDSIALEIDDGVFTTKLSGKLTPLFGKDKGLKWPTFDVKDLTIDSEGNVKLPGGWLSLAQQKTFDFHGFKIEISQIGFGKTDDGGKWVGFSGGLKLVEGLEAGASVEGLRITWYDDGRPTKISLNGAGVELKIKGVLELKGSVSYREMKIGNEEIKRFDGDIKLKLKTPEMAIDGMMVIGSAKGPQGRYTFFAIYVDVELPTAITIASTGLAIYNIAGLFALQMEPNKKPEEKWFSIDHSKSFYHRNTPGVIDLKNKWDPRKGSFAIGAGLKIGTYADTGYTFNGKFLLAIVLPGPIILFQGASNFLTKGDDAQEGQFRSLAVYDGRAGSFLIGLDAEYKTGKGGELIEIAGSMEAYYSFRDPTAWHLWLGQKDPTSLRIRAILGKFVEANAYFMLDAHQLALGAWFGYSAGWNFGPLSVRLEAWAEGHALISFKPTHFHGDLWLHALVELNAFGFGLGIALDAKIAADLFRPYHLKGEFSVGVKLPFRKKKLGATVVLEWGPKLLAPPLPLPLSQAAVEHLKSTVVWPLPRGQFLLPSYDDGGGFYTNASGTLQPADLSKVPLVPLDSRISLTFGRSVHDAAAVGVNLQPIVPPEEGIGHPGGPVVATVRYELRELSLHKLRADGSWQLVAKSPKSGSTPTLFGAWVPVPQLPSGTPPSPGQTKLMLWSKSAFDFTRAIGSSWEEWVSDTWPDYPCIPVVPAQESCFGFGQLADGTQIKSPWTYAGPPRLTLSWGFGPAIVRDQALCFPGVVARHGVRIECEPGQQVRMFLRAQDAVMLERTFHNASVEMCIDLREQVAGTRPNPWNIDGVRFTLRGADGALVPQLRIERWGQTPLGLHAGWRLDVELPCASNLVELIVTHRPPFRIVAFNGAGAVVATHEPATTTPATETIRLFGNGMTRLEVHAVGNEKLIHSICCWCPAQPGPSATGHDDDGNEYGPFHPTGGVIEVNGDEITDVVLVDDKGFCIERICVTPDVDAGQVMGRKEMIEHIRQELVRWKSEGALLEPHSIYRLTVFTHIDPHPIANITMSAATPVEHAYFRTEGPPGITRLLPPAGVKEEDFDSGLDDLVRYVDATDPHTVPPPGEKPILFKPFYRAYDLAVQFNEPYVEQMYRMDGRDLGLYVYDNSNRPARDAKGGLLTIANRWGVAETLTLSEKDTRWVTQINNATCLEERLDSETFPRASTLASADANRVLAPNTLYEVRLVPLLLHEAFARATLGAVPAGWIAQDSGAGGPSLWQTGELGEPPSRFVEQVSAVGGTTLLHSASSQWTDYRITAYVRASIHGEIGIVVRDHYRFTMDATHRRLMAGSVLLAEEHFAYQKDRDYRLTIEVLENVIRTYVDGEPVFEVQDSTHTQGRIGLYVANSAGAQFSDVAVDDLRREAPVAYRFQLTTSWWANFFHHMHSFDDELWSEDLGAQDVSAQLAEAVAANTMLPPSEAEARAYDELATLILGQAERQNPERLEITRVKRDGAASMFLLRNPEPIDPLRTTFGVARSPHALVAGDRPGAVKLVDMDGDSVTLLLREATDLTRHRIELREVPKPVTEQSGDPHLWLEKFDDPESLHRFTIADAGAPSQWRWERGALVETSGTGGGNEPELPGTHALLGDAEWQDYRVSVELRSDTGGEIGIVFRHIDDNNYYRVSFGATRSYRRLAKCVAGVTSVLWEDANGYAAGEQLRLVVQAVGSHLSAFLDDTKLFDLDDATHAAGRVGLYAADNRGARFEHIDVRVPTLEARALFTAAFDEGAIAGFTPFGDVTWTDVILQTRVAARAGVIAFAVRVQDAGNCYRVSIDGAGERKLVKQLAGVTTVLWRDTFAHQTNRIYELTLSAIGNTLRGFIDGAPVFVVDDADLPSGCIALDSPHAQEVHVWPASEMFDDWDFEDAFASLVNARWTFAGESGEDETAQWSVENGALRTTGTPVEVPIINGIPQLPPLFFATHYAIATQREFDELRITAPLRLDVVGEAGVVFGWQDSSNRAVFWLSRTAARLDVTTNGTLITWWDGAMPNNEAEHVVTIDRIDGRLLGYIDGIQLFAIDAAAPMKGRVGFVASTLPAIVSPQVQFLELQVAEPRWTTLHAFGAEERMPAGTRVQVFGTRPAVIPAEAGLVARSIALEGERGRQRLRGETVSLRVVAPDGKAGHRREFLSSASYTFQQLRLLRKADCTACFILPEGWKPSKLSKTEPGSLLLDLTFFRDRHEAGRQMNQAGNHTPEHVKLVLPLT